MSQNFDELRIGQATPPGGTPPIPVGEGEVVFSFVGDLGGLVLSLPEEGVSVALDVPPSPEKISKGEITND